MLGIALEGGGAKGAFQIGAIKALLEEGYKIDGIVGTSIGAFNAAMIAQGDFEACLNMWRHVSPEMLFDIENRKMANVINKNIDRKTISYFSSEAKKIILNRGIDTQNLRKVVNDLVDEEKLRNSNTDFGLVTVELGPLTPLEIYKEEIPLGKLNDYIMASARYPGLKMGTLDGKAYLDGGIYDNCPVSLLAKKNYDKIIAIRLNSGKKLKHIEDDTNVIKIEPSMDLGGTFIFTKEITHRNLKLGYYDAIRVIRKLKGRIYYIEPIDEDEVFEKLLEIPKDVIIEIGKIMGIYNIQPRRMLFEFIIPNFAKYLNLDKNATYQDILIALLEEMAKERNIEKFKIYSLEEFWNIIKGSDRETSLQSKMSINLKALRRLAIENLTQIDVSKISDKLIEILDEKDTK